MARQPTATLNFIRKKKMLRVLLKDRRFETQRHKRAE